MKFHGAAAEKLDQQIDKTVGVRGLFEKNHEDQTDLPEYWSHRAGKIWSGTDPAAV